MSTGTKAFLTLFAAAIAVLVLYYGLLMPESPRKNPEAGAGVVDPAVNEAAAPRQENPPRSDSSVDQPDASSMAPGNASTAPAVQPPMDSVVDALDGILPIALSRTDPTNGKSNGEHTMAAGEQAPPVHIEQPTAPPPAVALTPTSDVQSPATVVIKPSQPTRPPAATNTPPSTTGQTTEYVVQSGDTFISIADDHFGDGKKWDLIAKANPLVDPNRLKIGQKLRLPPKDAKRPAPVVNPPAATGAAAGTTYTVQSEDTLYSIAEALLGDKTRWRDIFEANRAAMKDNPDKLVIGMTLVIPK